MITFGIVLDGEGGQRARVMEALSNDSVYHGIPTKRHTLIWSRDAWNYCMLEGDINFSLICL